MPDVRRRELIALLGGAAAWPLAAKAQQRPAMPVIAFLRSSSSAGFEHLVAAFREGLREAGFVEGLNCAIEYRWADNKFDRLPALVADLLRWPITAIVTNTPGAVAAKAATTMVPIVFVTGADPVRDGLVASLNRPGANVTGISFLAPELGAKHLGLLRELRPGAARIAVIDDPKIPHDRAVRLGGPSRGLGHGAANRGPLRQQRPRNRSRLYKARPTWGPCAARWQRRVLVLPSGTGRRASGTT